MRIGAVLVHYYTPELVAPALDALERSARAANLALRVVVVDNGNTDEGRATLADLGKAGRFLLIEAGANLGYAGGVNRGVDALADVDAYLLMNPDVVVEEETLAPLASALSAGAAVVGPRCYWDEIGGFQLPMTESRGLADELSRGLAGWGTAWAAAARSRWRRQVYPFFTATEPRSSWDLSGALLLVAVAAWRRVGRFDEGYALYFEETDWLSRARKAGLPALFVPSAQALHLYAQSTPAGGAHDKFETSRRRFRRGLWGGPITAGLERLEGWARRRGRAPVEDPEVALDQPWPADADIRFLEISPSPWGFPAACRRLPEGLPAGVAAIPAALRNRVTPDGSYWLRALAVDGTERYFRRVDFQAKSLSPSV